MQHGLSFQTRDDCSVNTYRQAIHVQLTFENLTISLSLNLNQLILFDTNALRAC